jgi:hypothetical protein
MYAPSLTQEEKKEFYPGVFLSIEQIHCVYSKACGDQGCWYPYPAVQLRREVEAHRNRGRKRERLPAANQRRSGGSQGFSLMVSKVETTSVLQ